jgi:glycosyltransferase involved in cell wall biosynthesis
LKLIVQIPCYNEEENLGNVLKSIPREINGIDEVEILVIDDGSRDATAEIAQREGVDHIVSHKRNLGLARAFETGVNTALQLGADIIVNTDGDNQYPQDMIPELVLPILNGEADVVVGDRQTSRIRHFSLTKRLLQQVGSRVVSFVSRTNTPDAVSGFRAYSREVAQSLIVITKFSYVIETIVQASLNGYRIVSIPIEARLVTRRSRLFKNTWQHVKRSAATIVRLYAVYEPFKTFLILSVFPLLFGGVLGVRYLYYFAAGEGGGHVQSLILAAVLLMVGFQTLVLAVLADLVRVNRKLIEKYIRLMPDDKSEL